MNAHPLTQEDVDAWEALCKAEYAKWRARNSVPSPVMFSSGSAWFNAGSDWGRLWYEHIRPVGDSFFACRGHHVDWGTPSNEQLRVLPSEQ